MRSFSFAIALVVIGAMFWARYVLGPSPLDIHDVHWIHGDLAQVYIAWGQFFSDPHGRWLSTNRLSYPLSMSVSLFDPMPLMVLLARPFAHFVAAGLQFMGWYLAVCVVLQGIFGFLAVRECLRLMKVDSEPRANYVALLGAVLILSMPFTFFRFQYHVALSSQWLLVLSIWACLKTIRDSRTRWMLTNGGILFLSTGFTPYLALLVGLNATVFSAMSVRRIGPIEVIVRCVSLVVVALIGLYAFGYMVAAGTDSPWYGLFSMNALGPLSSEGLARLNYLNVPDATHYQQLEGFDYLGLGVIGLLLFPMALIGRNKDRKGFPFSAALVVIIACYVLSLSTTLTFWSYHVHVPAPPALESLLSHFRGSGRFFWLGGFWLVLLGMAGCVIKLGVRRASIAISILLIVQLIDIQPIALNTKLAIAKGTPETLQESPSGNFDAIFVYPAWECDPHATPLGLQNFEIVGLFALAHNIPTNNFYAARTTADELKYQCDLRSLPSRIDPHAIYILSSNAYALVAQQMHDQFDCNNRVNGDKSWRCVPRKSQSLMP